MKNKAGSFFKNVISKGKNILKKGSAAERQQEEEDNGIDEDNDIIEIGKQTLNRLSDLAGSTMQVADSYLSGNSIASSLKKE